MTRFTETAKWRDPWFASLKAGYKLVFIYITEHCDNAGFFEPNIPFMVMETGLPIKAIEAALSGALLRGLVGPNDGWYWLRNFLTHQRNLPLNPANHAHRQILRLLESQAKRFESSVPFTEFMTSCATLTPATPTLSPSGAPAKGPCTGTGRGIVGVRVKEEKSTEKSPKKRFQKPTREEAQAYGKEIGMKPDNVDGWYDHFESNGWKVSGKTPMACWKSSLRNSHRNPIFVRRPEAPPKMKLV